MPAATDTGEPRSSALAAIRAHLAASAAVKLRLAESATPAIAAAGAALAECIARGGKILLCGNGGSAADCQHIAAELTNRLNAPAAGAPERRAIAAIALTTDTSYLTARANDHGFDGVYERLIDALGRPGDALVAISTSGNSRNVVRAAVRAREAGLVTVALLGGTGGRLVELTDFAIVVPSESTQHIQESHLAIGHILCDLIEKSVCGSGGAA